METMKKTHGGKRKGSGRKAKLVPTKKNVTLVLDIELICLAKEKGLCLSKELNAALKKIVQ